MNLLSTGWNFIKRNKAKFVIAGGAVASFALLNRYIPGTSGKTVGKKFFQRFCFRMAEKGPSLHYLGQLA